MPTERVRRICGFIGANVRRGRVRKGMTQAQLAEAADLDLRFVQRVEQGRTNLGVAVLVSLADALELEPQGLFKPATLQPSKGGRPRKRRSRE